jgi:hypothetical protein
VSLYAARAARAPGFFWLADLFRAQPHGLKNDVSPSRFWPSVGIRRSDRLQLRANIET